MRQLALVIALAACADRPDTSYRFQAAIHPWATSWVAIEGALPFDETYDSYEEAVDSVRLRVRLSAPSKTSEVDIRPGYCHAISVEVGAPLGPLSLEAVVLVDTVGLTLHAIEADCIGAEHRLMRGY